MFESVRHFLGSRFRLLGEWCCWLKSWLAEFVRYALAGLA
jgi:hypothetical protein